MEIVLHIGAHRTATTSFQAYMRGNAPGLVQGGVAFWGPLRTRNGLFSGLWAPVQPSPKAGAAVAPLALPSPPLGLHLNAAPRYTGFSPTHSAQLRSAYEAMLRHFAAASVGPVTLLNKTMPDVQGKTPAPGPIPRGQTHEHQGPVAQTG